MSVLPSPEPSRIRAIVRAFRHQACGVQLPLRERVAYWRAYARLAHEGRQQHSRTHDAVYEPGPLRERYERALARLERRLLEAPQPRTSIAPPEFDAHAIAEEDVHGLMRSNVPFVLRGGADAVPARQWTLASLREKAGSAEVPINDAEDRPEEDRSRPTKAHRYYRFRRGPLSDVIDSIESGGHARTTTAEDVMHHAGGRLRGELDLDHWERLSGWQRNREHWLRSRLLAGKIVGAQLMVQPENAFTLWHAEPGDNFFVLIAGTKRWTMAHPLYTAAMRPRVKTTTNYHGSNIDLRESEAVLAERGFGAYLHVPKVTVTMRPGDVLRVPNHWWHTVVTDPGSPTIAVTIRSGGMPNLVGFGYTWLRWKDEQYTEMARAFLRDGRIRDEHIGFPRPPREETRRARRTGPATEQSEVGAEGA